MRCAPFIAGVVIVIAIASFMHRARSQHSHMQAHRFAAEAQQFKQKIMRHFKHPRPPAPAPVAAAEPVAPPPALHLVDTTPDESAIAFHAVVAGRPQLDLDDAVEAALQEAQQKVAKYLAEQKLVGDWQPPVQYIKDHLLRDVNRDNVQLIEVHDSPASKEITIDSPGQGRFKALEVTQTVDGTRMYQVYLRVVAGQDDLAEMQTMAHHERMAVRMLPLARVLGCLVALFAAIGLYIRFDELTRGYYRTVLRVGATGFVAAAWVALAWPVVQVLLGG